MLEFFTTLLTINKAFSAAERQANSLSFLPVAPAEPLLQRSGTGSGTTGLFSGLAFKLIISSSIYASGEKTLFDSSVTAFSVPVDSADTVRVQGKDSNGLSINFSTIRILEYSGGHSFRVGHTFIGVARP
jgi:hypothetical protein